MAERLGPYTLERRIGAGGMADVFLAQGPRGTCVVKRPHPHLCAHADFVRMFLDEASLLAQLHHPGIAQVYDLGEVGGVYYLAMEYVPGFDLMTISLEHERQGELMAPELCARIVADAAGALHYAHEAKGRDGRPLNIIHRDITPHNILLSTSGEVKLIDFGVARASSSTHRTQAGLVKGKYPYMAPEQVTGQEIDRRVDVYALGLVLYELLTNVRAIQGNTEVEQIDNARASRIRPIEQLRPNVSEPIRLILGGCLHPDPQGRYPTALHVKEDLEKYLVYERRPVGQEDLLRLFRVVAAEVAHEEPAPEPSPTVAPVPAPSKVDDTWQPNRKTELEQPVSDPSFKAIGFARTEPSVPKPVPLDPTWIRPPEAHGADADTAPAQAPLPLHTELQPSHRPARPPTTEAVQTDLESMPEPHGTSTALKVAAVVVGLAAMVVATLAVMKLKNGAGTTERPTLAIEVDAGPTLGSTLPEIPPPSLDPAVDAGAPLQAAGVEAAPDAGTPVEVPAVDAGAELPPPSPQGRATVVADCDPASDLIVDGTPCCKTPHELELSAGRHTVVFSNPRESFRKTVTLDVKAGERRPLALKFQKGTVEVSMTPFGELFLFGQRLGNVTAFKELQLYEGRYVFDVQLNDAASGTHLKKKLTVEVKAGQTVKAAINMLQ